MCKFFYVKKYDFDAKSGRLRFFYEVDGHGVFEENVFFPGAPFEISPADAPAFHKVVSLAHVAAGISYYKAFLPKEIRLNPSGALTPAEAAFFDRFYLHGLGEFAVRNNLNLQGKIHFPATASGTFKTPFSAPLSGVLVPVGGGKDSCVSLALLAQAGVTATTVSVGTAQPIDACCAVAGLKRALIRRELDPRLLALNAAGKTLNGHIPITGVLAFYLWIFSLLTGREAVVMSCEKSAESGNLRQGDLFVNHQFSKSLSFEKDFFALTAPITPGWRYFSLLRPLSELQIGALFAALCQPYFPVFTSCNKAFRLDKSKRLTHWCGACDKCRFVFLILAPFMEPADLIKAVGHNLLDDETQKTGYLELLGLQGHKPFECVGTVAECRDAFRRLQADPRWQESRLIREISLDSALETPEETPGDHAIPEKFQPVLSLMRAVLSEKGMTIDF